MPFIRSDIILELQQLFQFFNKKQPRLILYPVLFAIAAVLAAACSKQPVNTKDSQPTLTPQVTLPAPQVTEIQTQTALPTSAPPEVLMVTPPGADQLLATGLKTELSKKAENAGMKFSVQDTLGQADARPEVRVILVLPPDPGVATLAVANPRIQFIAVGIAGLKSSANLSLIAPDGFQTEQQAFLAGYISAIVTPDWRVGVIPPSDNDTGARIRDAFKNGAVYFCGLCRPAYPPFAAYPQSAAASSDPSTWQNAADSLLKSSVQTVYLSDQISSADLLDYLDKAKVNLIGGPLPSGEKYGHWLASLGFDPVQALDTVWPEVVAGKGGASLQVPITITNVNTSLITEGRMRLIQQVLADLAAGKINPNAVPDQ